MDIYSVQFYFLLLFVNSNVLAMSVDNESEESHPVPVVDTVSENLGSNLKSSSELVEEKWTDNARFEGILSEGNPSSTSSSPSSLRYDGSRLSTPSRDLARWPSKVDRFAVSNDILGERETGIIRMIENLKQDQETRKRRIKPTTVEEVENRNANIYNPLLNLDHYPKPAKKYTVIELENMNANHYNPYLN